MHDALKINSHQDGEPVEDDGRLMFRTLCAYRAMALDHASYYRHLGAMHAKLVEKRMSLDGICIPLPTAAR